MRSRIESHVLSLQRMLAEAAGDAAETRRTLEDRADLTKSYSEALFDGCVRAVSERVKAVQEENRRHVQREVRGRGSPQVPR